MAFVLCAYFEFCALIFGFISNAYALNLDRLKVDFLKGNYKSAILEGEKILATSSYALNSDELYYLLALSYLKDGNYLRASDIFEIILKEFRDGVFKEEAKLGLGDASLMRGDYKKAEKYYKDLIDTNPYTKLRALVYYRLSQVGLKQGNNQQAEEFLSKLKQNFPLNLELKLNQDLDSLTDIYYTVQVGSFVSLSNARTLCNKLISKGYDAYLQESVMESKKIFRIRVGKIKSYSEAVQLKNKLSQEGYPTKIIP